MIEEKIKNDLEEYEIKTSSEDILNAYYARKEKKTFKQSKKPIIKWPIIAILSSVAAVIVCAVIALLLLNPFVVKPNNPDKPTPSRNVHFTQKALNDSETKLSELSFQLFYGCSMNNALIEKTNNPGMLASSLEPQEIDHIVSNIEKSYNMLISMYANENGLSYDYIKLDSIYKYNNKEYAYKLITGSFVLYMQEDIVLYEEDDGELEWESEALIVNGDNVYNGMIEIEQEKEESSMTLKYYDGDYIYCIERDYENLEYSMEYVIYYAGEEEDNIVEAYEIEIEYDNNKKLECSYNYINPKTNVELIIETKKTQNGMSMLYTEVDDEEELYSEIDIKIVDLENIRKYIINGQEKIINK